METKMLIQSRIFWTGVALIIAGAGQIALKQEINVNYVIEAIMGIVTILLRINTTKAIK